MGDHHKLALSNKSIQNLDESVDVRFVERSVHFIQHTEWARLHHIDGKQQRNRRHRLFSTGKKGNRLELFTWRFCDDLNPTLERIRVIHQKQIRFAASEQFTEHFLEVSLYLLEGSREQLFGGRVNLVDHIE